MKPLILSLILLATLLDSYFYGMNLYEYRFYFEPFIIPLILVYYLISSKKKNFLIFSAFFFVWLGDLLLLIGVNTYFFTVGCLFLLDHAIVFHSGLFEILEGLFV
jgi:uncharacterized membrane protein YhhN